MKELFKDIIAGVHDFGNSVGNFVSGIILIAIFLILLIGIIALCIWLRGLFQKWGEKGGKKRERFVFIVLNSLFAFSILSFIGAVIYFFWLELLYFLGFCVLVILWSLVSERLNKNIVEYD